MSITPVNNVQQIVTNYQAPPARAMSNASRTALAALITLGLLVLPSLKNLFTTGDYSHAALVSLANGIGVSFVIVLTSYLLSLQHAISTDPIYQAQRAATQQMKSQQRFELQRARYGVPAPTLPAAAGYVLTPNAPPHA